MFGLSTQDYLEITYNVNKYFTTQISIGEKWIFSLATKWRMKFGAKLVFEQNKKKNQSIMILRINLLETNWMVSGQNLSKSGKKVSLAASRGTYLLRVRP